MKSTQIEQRAQIARIYSEIQIYPDPTQIYPDPTRITQTLVALFTIRVG